MRAPSTFIQLSASFHGIHVSCGVLLLSFDLFRLFKFHFNHNQRLGLGHTINF